MSKPVLAHTHEIGNIISYVAMGFFFYDTILSLPFDWSIISGKRQRRWPQLAYFGAKIFYLAYVAITFYINYAINKIYCKTALQMLEMVMGFVTITSSILLACRTVCVFQGSARKAVSVILTVLSLCLIAAWMQGVTDVESAWDPSGAQPWTTGACAFVDISMTYWVKYVVTIIFDLAVLCLTTYGIFRMNGSSHIGRVLIRQGLVYFIVTLVANLVITIMTTLKLSPLMSLLFAVPQSTTCVICACRLYIELAEESKTTHLTSGAYNQSSSYGSGESSNKGFGSSMSGFGKRGGFLSSHGSSEHGKGSLTTSLENNASMRPSNTTLTGGDLEKQQNLSHDQGYYSNRSGATSRDDFVEASEQPRDSTNGVLVEQERAMEVDSTPAYMHDVHPFSGPFTARNNSAKDAPLETSSARPMSPSQLAAKQDDEVDADLAAKYPRLLSRKAVN